MDAAKIRLSPKELEMVKNADWILTKNAIMEKTIALFASLQVQQQAFINDHPGQLPAEVTMSTPKISRGEKYEGLPYVMLDYPRYFVQHDILAIRTLFWWGHFFSVTLHISGRFKKMLEKNIITGIAALKTGDWFICVEDDPWNHDLHSEHYTLLHELNEEETERVIMNRMFIKLAMKISLEQWNEDELFAAFQQLTGLLIINKQ